MKSVEITDPTFRYGLGVFETILVRQGIPFFDQWHWENLCEASHALGLPIPDEELLRKKVSGDGILRWFVTSQGVCDFFEQSVPPIPESVRVDISDLKVSSRSWEARYKTTSYLLHYQAKKQSHADEAILLNENGVVASASMANVFFVQDGKLCTPLPETGCRRGVVRRWVIEKSGINVLEGAWTVEDLRKSDEIFLTNSRIGICPVIRCGDAEKGIGKMTAQLRKSYLAELM